MDYFFYSDNKDKHGPFTLDELKSKIIYKDYLIYKSGDSEWRSTSYFSELTNNIVSKPPPLPEKPVPLNNEIKVIKLKIPNPIFFENKKMLTIGIIALVINIFGFLANLEQVFTGHFFSLPIIFSITYFPLNIISVLWIVDQFDKWKLKSKGYPFLAFFYPSIALILVGKMKVFKYRVIMDERIANKEKVDLLLNVAIQKFKRKNYHEALALLEKAQNIDPTNVVVKRNLEIVNKKFNKNS